VADLSASSKEGVSFGVRYSLYAFGFMCGGAIASYLMSISQNNFRLVFWLSFIPAFISFCVLYFFVKDPLSETKNKTLNLPSHLNQDIDGSRLNQRHKSKWNLGEIKYMPASFWHLMMVIFLLMNARFSDSFLQFRGRELGFAIAMMPLFMMLYNFLEAIAPMPIGKLADSLNRRLLFLCGVLVLALANIVILFVPFQESIIISLALAGLHMGMTQGLLGTLVAGATLPHLRGTAFAIYYCVTGLGVFTGNFAAGHFSQTSDQMGHGVLGAFEWGLFATTLSALYLIFWIKIETVKKK
jgi:MFS family permease